MVQGHRGLLWIEGENREIQARITFRTKSEDEAREILKPLNLRTDDSSFIQSVTLPISDERYSGLISALSRRAISHNEYRDWLFSDAELESADLLHMKQTGYWGFPQPEDSYKKESYDMNTACPVCGTPSNQTRPFLVRGHPKFGRNDILALNWTYEFLVTDRLKRLIEQARLKGAEFWPILDAKRRMALVGYYQLKVTNELPPMSSRTPFKRVNLRDLETPCRCGRLGLMIDRISESGPVALPRYERNVLGGASDFNRTHEWLSEGFDAHQWKIVNQRTFKLFKEWRIRGVRFEPVIIEDQKR